MYLLYGLEDYLIQEEIKKIIEKDKIEEININKYNLENNMIDNVIEDATTISLFQDKKVIIVENAYIFSGTTNKKLPEQNTDLLLDYLNHSNPNTVLIFTLIKDKIDTRKKITTLMKKNGTIKEFNTVSNINNWITKELEPYQMDKKEVEYFINRVGNNLSILKEEIDKLKLYKDDEKVITQKDIEQLTHKNIDTDIFKLIDSILSTRKKEALESLEEMMKYGEEPIAIIVMLANQFRIMYQSKQLLKKGYSEREIANLLEIHEFRVKKALEKGRKYSSDEILKKLEDLADLDYQIKSGQLDKNIGLELFILNM
ncbi:MAG: DNA polymerase III subunit delta [Tenericutes bacterium]|nr:DNA polymerase III subunit delta [Mycoplasmatota bacterium]